MGIAIAVDAHGYAYVAGNTYSNNFPTSSGAFHKGYGGYQDAFAVKLNPFGTGVDYSTYLEGNGDEYAQGNAIDQNGNAYVIGFTNSTDFPTSIGALQTISPNGGTAFSGFVSKFNSTGAALDYSTYLGGSGDNQAYKAVLDSCGNFFVVGQCNSTDFFTTAGAFETSNPGDYSPFVVKFDIEACFTATPTLTATYTSTPTQTRTPTKTKTPTPTPSATPTQSKTLTPSPTPTTTYTPTFTITFTPTPGTLCTLTQGYWKTHSQYSTNPVLIRPWPISEDTLLCGMTWYNVLQTEPNGNAWYVLAHQWIAASLNGANGASSPEVIQDALAQSQALLSGNCAFIPLNLRTTATNLSGLLDEYNNGVIGPGHCSWEMPNSSQPVIYPNPADGNEPIYIHLPSYSGNSDVEVKVYTTDFRIVQDSKYPLVFGSADIPMSLMDKQGVFLANGLYYVKVKTSSGAWILKLLVLR